MASLPLRLEHTVLDRVQQTQPCAELFVSSSTACVPVCDVRFTRSGLYPFTKRLAHAGTTSLVQLAACRCIGQRQILAKFMYESCMTVFIADMFLVEKIFMLEIPTRRFHSSSTFTATSPFAFEVDGCVVSFAPYEMSSPWHTGTESPSPIKKSVHPCPVHASTMERVCADLVTTRSSASAVRPAGYLDYASSELHTCACLYEVLPVVP